MTVFLQKLQKTQEVMTIHRVPARGAFIENKGVRSRRESAKKGDPKMKVFLQKFMKTKDSKWPVLGFYRCC
jgi:hypothetical protein